MLSYIWNRLPSMLSAEEPKAALLSADCASPKPGILLDVGNTNDSLAKPLASTPKTKAVVSAPATTPGTTGRARREAKRQSEALDPSDFRVSMRMDGAKTIVAWKHGSCRPGDVDAWIGLHEVQNEEDDEEMRHKVGSLELSTRIRFKAIRSTKLEAELVFPLNEERLDDGEYVLALHNMGGVVGDENLFLAITDVFSVRKGKVISTPSSNKRLKK